MTGTTNAAECRVPLRSLTLPDALVIDAAVKSIICHACDY